MSLLNSFSMGEEEEEELVMDADWCVASSSCDGLGPSVTGSDNLGGELLEGLESYLEDINDRLIISRMVSDSVIKGMVNAIAQVAHETISMKELEVAELKQTLSNYHHMDQAKFHSTRLVNDLGLPHYLAHPHGSDFLVVHDRLTRSLADLIASANDHFAKLQNDIDNMQGYVPPMRNSSGAEMVDEKDERWTHVFRTLHSLKLVVENAFQNLDNIVQFCDSSLREWKQDQQLQEEIEAMVIRHGILGLEEKIVRGSKEHDCNNHGSNNVNWCDSIGEFSKLRMEMDVISRSLSVSDDGLASHGSVEFNEEWNHAKRTDVFHRKTSLWEGNVKHDSQIIIPENLECAQFKHMTKDDLFSYLKAEMIKMKRDHESVVHEMTEEYFSLKRKGPSMPSNKDKEFIALRKHIPEVILKLDAILCKNENVTKLRNSVEGVDKLQSRLDNVLSENHHLKGLLSNTQKEVKRLSVITAEAQERMSQHSFTEMNLLKKIRNLNNSIQDMHTEALISEEIHKCILKEMNFIFEDRLKSPIWSTKEQEPCQCAVQKPYLDDSFFEHMITQELLCIILTETVKHSEESLHVIRAKHAKDSLLQTALQKTILEKEKALNLGVEEKDQLMKELNSLREAINKKEQMMHEVTAALIKTKENFEVATKEVITLRENNNVQKLLVSSRNKEIMDLNSRLACVFEHKTLLEARIDELNGKQEYLLTELNKINEERAMLLARSEDNQSILSLFVREKEEHRKQLDAMQTLLHGLTKEIGDFEWRVGTDIEIKNSRLEDARSQLNYLIKKCNIQRRTGLLYKQRLERKTLDLQKAEAEVDVLGDEVDVLLNLLEKIYIALDHYSPILKHYPGIVEILKLVKSELSGESTKQHRRHFAKDEQNEYTKYTGREKHMGN